MLARSRQVEHIGNLQGKTVAPLPDGRIGSESRGLRGTLPEVDHTCRNAC